MANYQRYQHYQSTSRQSGGWRWLRWLLLMAIVLVLYLIVHALFSTPSDIDSNVPDMAADTVAPAATNTDAEMDITNNVVNTNSNSNTNAANINTLSSVTFEVADCDRVYSRGSGRRVVLTFNVGTTKSGELPSLLDALKDGDAPAAFFVRGDVAEEAPDLITTISNNGFPVYNLSYNHPRFTDLPESGMREQLQKADAAISAVTGTTTKPFFRPPYGAVDEDVLAVAVTEGYCPVTWTVDALDWSSDYTAAASQERVMDSLGDGSIVLMQASNAITAEIIPDLIRLIRERGYEIVSLDRLLSS